MQDFIDGHLIKDGKVVIKKLENQQGKSEICNITKSALCCMYCMQKILTHSKVTKQKKFSTYNIPLHCKSQWIKIICNLQYVGKSETSFSIRLNNHRKDMSNSKAIPVYFHFRKEEHNFFQDAKFNRAAKQNGKC